ncbi:MAG: hypothetical protein ABGY41_23280, partial [Candidatus Poribacteria bacterium]
RCHGRAGNDSSIDALETTPLARDADGRRVALVDEASAPSTGLPVSSALLLLWWTGVAVALQVGARLANELGEDGAGIRPLRHDGIRGLWVV